VWPSLAIGLGLAVLLGLGVVALVLAWSRAAGTPLVPLQMPALLAAMVGIGLIGTGLAVLDLDGLRRQEAEEAEALEAAVEGVRRWAELGRPVRTD
jgi:cyanate permease